MWYRVVLGSFLLVMLLSTSDTCAMADEWPMPFVRLWQAAQSGNKNEVADLLACGVCVDTKSDAGGTVLFLASLCSQQYEEYVAISMIDYLVARGANVNLSVPGGLTPLHGAAAANRADVVKLLVGKGAKIDAKTAEGCTPLHYAAHQRAYDAVEMLICLGASRDVRDDEGSTPYHYAVQVHELAQILKPRRSLD